MVIEFSPDKTLKYLSHSSTTGGGEKGTPAAAPDGICKIFKAYAAAGDTLYGSDSAGAAPPEDLKMKLTDSAF